jgi:hypothetical protein
VRQVRPSLEPQALRLAHDVHATGGAEDVDVVADSLGLSSRTVHQPQLCATGAHPLRQHQVDGLGVTVNTLAANGTPIRVRDRNTSKISGSLDVLRHLSATRLMSCWTRIRRPDPYRRPRRHLLGSHLALNAIRWSGSQQFVSLSSSTLKYSCEFPMI